VQVYVRGAGRLIRAMPFVCHYFIFQILNTLYFLDVLELYVRNYISFQLIMIDARVFFFSLSLSYNELK